MANPDFKKFVFKNVTFAWPRLDQPYRYNQQEEKTEPCAAGAPNAGYSIAWEVDTEEAKKLHGELKEHYNDCRKRNAKLPEFSSVFGLKQVKDDDGKPTGKSLITAKKRAMSNDGKENKMPTVVGADHEPLADKAIWGGSEGHVRVLAYAVTNPQDGTGGISLLLDAVVVTKAEYGGDGLGDDFGDPVEIDDLPKAETIDQAAEHGADADDVPF